MLTFNCHQYLSWIQDFLSDRTQTVELEGNSSSTNPVASGVPQGTVLGPLLFLVYINDMPGYARSQTRLFDCIMQRKVSSTSDCTQLQEDLDNSIKWEQQWQMQFNPDKCEVLTITKKRKPLHHDYIIHGHIPVLQHVDSTKYISKNLSWNTHVDAITHIQKLRVLSS